MQVSDKHQSQLERIKKNINSSYIYFKENNERFNKYRSFTFNSTISDSQRTYLNELGKPDIECNILEAYISRLRGEFSKNEPSVECSSADGISVPYNIVQTVEAYLRAIFFESNNDEGCDYKVYTDQLSGGFSVVKAWTEYMHSTSFDQVIMYGRVFDPTLCGFDPLARLPHKGDGRYCFEYFPKYKEDFEQEYPGVDITQITFQRTTTDYDFNWSYSTENGKKIVVLCQYYEKKKKRKTLFKLADGRSMYKKDYEDFLAKWIAAGHMEQPPAIVKERKTTQEIICRYTIIADKVIEYIETDFSMLPLLFVDGNSIELKDGNGATKQMTRPYIYQAMGIQQLLNFSIQTLAYEMENMVSAKFIMSEESISPNYSDAITDNSSGSPIIYKELYNNDPNIRLSPPQVVPRPPIPPEISNAIQMATSLSQTILGSYDASLGINDNQLSGVAIVEAATQSNAAAMPYIVSNLQYKNRLAEMIVDLIPKYYVTPRTIPVVTPDGKKSYQSINNKQDPHSISLAYSPNALNVKVEAGVNFAIQKSKALNQIIALAQAMPVFGQFINTMGLEPLLDNLEIRGIDQLKELAPKFQQMMAQQQQQSSQNNPMAQKNQIQMMEIQRKSQQDQMDNQFRQAEIANTSKELDLKSAQIQLEAQQSGMDNMVQLKKANAEEYSKAVDLALKVKDQDHQHGKSSIETLHNMSMDHANYQLDKQSLTNNATSDNFGS